MKYTTSTLFMLAMAAGYINAESCSCDAPELLAKLQGSIATVQQILNALGGQFPLQNPTYITPNTSVSPLGSIKQEVAGVSDPAAANTPSTVVPGTSASSNVAPGPPAAPASTGTPATTAAGVVTEGNPFVGKDFYANSFYAGEIAKNPVSPDLAAAAEKIKTIQTAYWLDKAAKVPSLTAQFTEAMAKQKETGKKQVFLMVVYDLPNRDCSAGASAGEFSAADGGMDKYKAYIDAIAKQVAAFPDLQIAAIVEPDSLPNLVTNLAVPKCKESETIYKEGIAYAIKALQMPNIALYLDIGHGAWLGFEPNRAPAAKIYAEVVKLSGGKIRGFATNVANFNPVTATVEDPIYSEVPVKDEASYVQAMAKEMTAVGLPANFVIDTGRSGAQKVRSVTGNWCNIKGAGFGPRPTAQTGIPNVDAFLWVKPGGESDGDSVVGGASAVNTCTSTDSVMPAPHAGEWFASYFADLIKNANPPIA